MKSFLNPQKKLEQLSVLAKNKSTVKILPWVTIAVIIAIISIFVALSIINQSEIPEEITKNKERKAVFLLTTANMEPLEQGTFEIWANSATLKKTVSLGAFNINKKGQMIDRGGGLIKDNKLISSLAEDEISDFFVTIEPDTGTGDDPSPIKMLEGEFINNSALLKFRAVNISKAKGTYMLATPTDGGIKDEISGIWFVSLSESGVTAFPALSLEPSAKGFIYQGWVLHDGEFISTGKFVRPDFKDLASDYSIKEGSDFGFPGEDFLINEPKGAKFPLNLADGKSEVLISLEPNIEGVDPTGEKPFQLKFLKAAIPKDAETRRNYDLTLDILNFPIITITLVNQ